MLSSDHPETPQSPVIDQAVSEASVQSPRKAGCEKRFAGNSGPAAEETLASVQAAIARGETQTLPVALTVPPRPDLERAGRQARLLVALLTEGPARLQVALGVARALARALGDADRSPQDG